jgi:hypothetical protein
VDLPHRMHQGLWPEVTHLPFLAGAARILSLFLCLGVHADIANEKTDLLTIVEALREYLTSSAVEQRCQGTRLLSETLISLSSRQLPQDDVHYLVAFYCDRLKDKVAVLPYVLRGLHAMVVNQRVSSDDVIVISRAIYSHVYNQVLFRAYSCAV